MTTAADTTTPTGDLSKLSPFELKGYLSALADEAVKTRAVTMLNAGRDNPNWIATTPREAFGLMLQFGLRECRRDGMAAGVGCRMSTSTTWLSHLMSLDRGSDRDAKPAARALARDR